MWHLPSPVPRMPIHSLPPWPGATSGSGRWGWVKIKGGAETRPPVPLTNSELQPREPVTCRYSPKFSPISGQQQAPTQLQISLLEIFFMNTFVLSLSSLPRPSQEVPTGDSREGAPGSGMAGRGVWWQLEGEGWPGPQTQTWAPRGGHFQIGFRGNSESCPSG